MSWQERDDFELAPTPLDLKEIVKDAEHEEWLEQFREECEERSKKLRLDLVRFCQYRLPHTEHKKRMKGNADWINTGRPPYVTNDARKEWFPKKHT